MRNTISWIITILLATGCMAGTAAASPAIVFDPASVTLAPGGTAQVALRLTEAPDGLNGYQFDIGFPPAIAKVTGASFPSWAILKKDTPGQASFRLSAIDLNKQVQAGLTNIELATITVTGVGSGTASMAISGLQIDSDADTRFSPSLGTLQVTVSGDAVTTTTTTATSTTSATATTTTTATATSTTSATATTTTAPVVTATTGVMPGAPIAGFTASENSGNAPLKVQFYDRSSGNPTSFEWDFGDGGTSMIQNPSYTYQTEGLYTVRLKVSNSKGSTSVTQKDYVAIGEKYIAMQPTATLIPTITGQDLPAPIAERTTAATSSGYTPATATTTRAAADIMTTITGVIGAALISVLVLTRKNR